MRVQESHTLLFVRRNSAIYVFTSSFVRSVVLVELKNSSGVGSGFAPSGTTKRADIVEADVSWRPDATDETLCFPAPEGCRCNTQLLVSFVG